jgi:two-component system, chemotaxis family, CheB/CheR fusion protein
MRDVSLIVRLECGGPDIYSSLLFQFVIFGNYARGTQWFLYAGRLEPRRAWPVATPALFASSVDCATVHHRTLPKGHPDTMPSSTRPSPAVLDGHDGAAARGPPGAQDGFAVVGIGASAGGLEACRKLLSSLPPQSGMAFILIQHLDPKHESMMVDLLSAHTTMAVLQAADGMRIQSDHFYIIPPGTYLSVRGGILRLSEPEARHGARLPVDFLFRSLADSYGTHAICVILSGTGTDGCLGLKAVKEKCGLVIAQNPAEAGFSGMPSAAIATGSVDLILPVAGMPTALLRYARRIGRVPDDGDAAEPHADWLPDIVDLLRRRTNHDFTLYKPGTLQRRVERRMAMASIESDSMERYLDLLRHDPAELELLARDLLINVTSFFRDPAVFEAMERGVVPDLIRACKPDRALRIWVAGCSTGEETYSLAMIFREQIQALQADVKLQLFASDVDPDAVAAARDGLYPESINTTVSAARLARFFSREEHGYRISPDLRASVVFTVQDVLADPPFSRLDLVSCRNLLIYLLPEAQARVISVFHFALREGGVLLLGSAETVGGATARFEVIAKRERIYRHIGRSRPGEHDFLQTSTDAARLRIVPGLQPGLGRQADLAELGKRLVLEAFAPAAVLINRAHECLFSLGPTDRYLRVPKGHTSLDVLAMARPGLRSKLAIAIRQAIDQRARVVVSGARMLGTDDPGTVTLDVRPVPSGDEDLLLVCFIDGGQTQALPNAAGETGHSPKIAEMAQALAAAQADLKSVMQDLEASAEEQKAATQEALSINEEFQSTNEELLTSKEELQSLNEELTALNSQLQETLERQRRTSDDLQNVLYSTDIATLFLDASLKIRFFTPATKSVFNVISGDIGRPLADLHSLVPESGFAADAQAVLRSLTPIEREIEAPGGVCFIRRIMPYRTHAAGAAGLVITFTDTTERKSAGRALEAAQKNSEAANAAKSRFLAAASHDLRQPLQTLALLQGLLARSVTGEKKLRLVDRMGDTVGAMSSMLNTLLDINQIDAGIVKPDFTVFRLDDILLRLRDEMAYQAESQRLGFRVVPCGLMVQSDAGLLEQMIRNLVSNAFKYTKAGRVLLGCRRSGTAVRIEIWDTGIGIESRELRAIFEEYHQLDNAARERSRGLGLGLPIVQRLGDLLGHRIGVKSWPGRGSVFTIEIAGVPAAADVPAPPLVPVVEKPEPSHKGTVLLVEDDPDIADLLAQFLKAEGHRVTTERDGAGALAHIERAALQPDVVLSDYNLPNGRNGLQVAAAIRAALHRAVPVIILTGDISTDTLRRVTQDHCLYLGKPVSLPALADAVQRALPVDPSVARLHNGGGTATDRDKALQRVFVVDDSEHVRNSLRAAVQEDGRIAETYGDSEAFLLGYKPGHIGCLLIDANLPGMSGLELLRHLRRAGDHLPAIMITGNGDVSMAVEAMKAGADDFIEKPVGYRDLLDAIDKAVEHSLDGAKRLAWRDSAAQHIAELTPRQRQIMDLVLAGQPSKNIAADLGISQRTVENHRASIMKRTGSHSLPALARLAVTAALSGAEG